jgi:hypothetical protein
MITTDAFTSIVTISALEDLDFLLLCRFYILFIQFKNVVILVFWVFEGLCTGWGGSGIIVSLCTKCLADIW